MSTLDGGRRAALGFQYQYLRTLEALLSALDRAEVEGCRIEGPASSAESDAVEVVDFDLVDQDGGCLLAAQVKSAAPGRWISAPEAFAILAEMVTKCDSQTYELITTAMPDDRCRSLSMTLTTRHETVEGLRDRLAEVLVQAPRARARLQALSVEEVERLGRCRVIIDQREEADLRRDLHAALRLRRTRHRAGLGDRSAGLILGYLTAEILRRAATPEEAYWRTADFAKAVLVEDDVLIRTLGRKDWGAVYGPVAPVPDIVRPTLLADVTTSLAAADNASGDGVRRCVVTGLSGIGKSSTAAAYLAEHADQYDLIFWADASTAEALAASFQRLWGHLHVQESDSPAGQSAEYLREQVHGLLGVLPGRWLIVFDDAFADTVADWIPRIGRGDVLITSVDDAGWTWADAKVPVDRMSNDLACALIARRLALTDEESARHQDILVSLSEALEGWPLAIELACGYLRSCGIPVDRADQYRSALLSRALEDRFSVPHGYPRTLVAAVDLSLTRLVHLLAEQQLLSRQVREVLGYLTYFAPKRIPIHLAALSAFISPEEVPADPLPTAVDGADVPVREIFRALVQVSFVHYAEPLSPLSSNHPASFDDTVSMNAVLQQILRQHYERALGSSEALSRSAFHTDRWAAPFPAGRARRPLLGPGSTRRRARHAGPAQGGEGQPYGRSPGQPRELQDGPRRPPRSHRPADTRAAWLDEIEQPNEALRAQTRIQLAHTYEVGELPEEADQAALLLPPVLPYIERIRREESTQNAAAVLTAQAASILEDLLRRHPHDERLVHLHHAFTTSGKTLPAPATVTEMARARALGQLMNTGQAEAAERAAREALAEYGEPWAGNAAEIHRILIEALATQTRWQEVEEEFDRFLANTGPHSLHRFSEQMILHNVGLYCAMAWIVHEDEKAASLLNRLVTEIDVVTLSQQAPPIERARFTLLKAVAAASRSDPPAFVTLMRELGTNRLDKETDTGTPWEDLLQRLVHRLSRIANTTSHESYQAQGEALLRTLPPGWQQHPDLVRILERAEVNVRLGLTSEPPFDALAFPYTPMPGAAGADQAIALAIMEPTHMLGVGTAEGVHLELQVHRLCSSGFRLVVPEAFSIPTPAGWTLEHRRGQLTLNDSTGSLRALARIKPPRAWLAAAKRHQRVFVMYGFGFDLDNPARRQGALASHQTFYQRIQSAAAKRVLAAGLVPWKP